MGDEAFVVGLTSSPSTNAQNGTEETTPTRDPTNRHVL